MENCTLLLIHHVLNSSCDPFHAYIHAVSFTCYIHIRLHDEVMCVVVCCEGSTGNQEILNSRLLLLRSSSKEYTYNSICLQLAVQLNILSTSIAHINTTPCCLLSKSDSQTPYSLGTNQESSGSTQQHNKSIPRNRTPFATGPTFFQETNYMELLWDHFYTINTNKKTCGSLRSP